MQTQDLFTLLLPSMLDGLFAAIATAIFAGIIIWFIQRKYEGVQKNRSLYQERIKKEEDNMYERINTVKNKFYNFYLNLSNSRSKEYSIEVVQETANDFIENMQTVLNISICNKVVLKDYYIHINGIFNKYSDFVNNFNEIQSQDIECSLEKEKYTENLLKEIMEEFYAIDRLYFYNHK